MRVLKIRKLRSEIVSPQPDFADGKLPQARFVASKDQAAEASVDRMVASLRQKLNATEDKITMEHDMSATRFGLLETKLNKLERQLDSLLNTQTTDEFWHVMAARTM